MGFTALFYARYRAGVIFFRLHLLVRSDVAYAICGVRRKILLRGMGL